MPDLDILPRTAPPGWRAADQLIKGCGTDEEIAKAVLQALSQSLRDGGGLPTFGRFANVAVEFAAGRCSHGQAMSEVRRIVQDNAGQRNAKVAERAVAHVLVDIANCELPGGDVHQVLAERFLWCLADHSLIGRRRPELVGGRYVDLDGACAAEEQYKAALRPKLAELASKLVRDPGAGKLRAPAMMTGPRRSTSDLLGMALMNLREE
jgi:hypothetical protein